MNYKKKLLNSSKQFGNILLAVGITLIPVTSWRLWKVGPSELIIFIWCFIHVLTQKNIVISKKYFMFWIIFIMFISIGTLRGLFMSHQGTEPIQILTWLYFMFVALILFSYTQTELRKNIVELMMYVIKFSTFFYLLVYLFTFKNKSKFLGALVWYGGIRFTGGAMNPHQFSIYSVVITFLSLYLGDLKNDKIYYLIAILFVYLGIKTESSTLYLSLFMGFSTLYISKKFQYKVNKKIKIVLFIIALLSFIIIFRSTIYQILYKFVESDVNGKDRFLIFKTYFEVWDKSFIFGLGPGAHARDSTMEFHNAYIELIMMGGVLSIVIFIIMFTYIYKSFENNPYFISVLLSILIYGLAGFVFRRLIVWVFLSIFYGYSLKSD